MKPKEMYDQGTMAAAVIFSEIWPIVVKYKKTVIILFIIELWVHSLMFQHIAEAKSIYDIFKSMIP